MTPRTLLPLAVAAIALALGACGGGETEGEAAGYATPVTAAARPTTAAARTEPAPEPRPAALPGLPAFTAGFAGWDRLNREPIPPDSEQTRRVGFDAHRGTKQVFVSTPRESLARGGVQRFPYPDGTIVVKAAGEDPGSPTLVAVMRKVAGSDPAHGDWEFQEYKRSGAGDAFATDDGLTGATCWGCHAIASGTDWVFTTLDP